MSPPLRRIAVVGCSGAGKSTLARRVASRIGVPHVELDAIYHQAGWKPLESASFRTIVTERCASDGWVVDGNYRAVRPLVWAQAQAVLWLDYPRSLVMRQIVSRTFARALFRTELWNGNRERLGDIVRWKPERSIIRWAWTQHARYRMTYEAAITDPAHEHLVFHRFRTHAEADAFVQLLPAA